MDTLSDVVQVLRLKARVFLHSSFCGDYAVETAGTGRATFHVVSGGECWLHMPDLDEPVQLSRGDLIVFPHDAEHTLSNSAVFPAADVPRNRPTPDPQGEFVSLICGDIDFMQSRWNPILDSLPSCLIIRREDRHHTSELEAVLEFMIEEAGSEMMGSGAVIDRLSDVLFIHVLRAYLARKESQESYLAALFDERIGPVIKMVHEKPEHHWTVQELAQRANMSRSVFAERFHSLIGLSPIEYVTGWRMQLAYEQLETSNYSTARIAELCGYQSESSFSKAFKKQFGINPGVIRRRR